MIDAVAIIPARGGSKRLPRKNILPLMGQPMLSWPVGAAIASGIFSAVIVSTEDQEVAQAGTAAGARVIPRPAEMATDEAHEFLAFRHVLDVLRDEGAYPQFFCGIYPTAALIQPEDLAAARALIETAKADVVMGVSSYGIHPFKALEETADGYLKSLYPLESRARSQTYPHYVASNGTFYFMRTESFLAKPDYYPARLAGYEIPATRAIDIDTEEDYHLAQILMEHYHRQQHDQAQHG